MRKYGCNSVIFEELYQEVFFILLEKQKNSGADPNYNHGYITQMCRRKWFKERERQGNFEKLDGVDPQDNPEENTRNGMLELLNKHLKGLSESCREVLKLYSQGYSEEKISIILNLGDAKKVNNKKHYCKGKLHKMIINDPLFDKLYG